MIYLARTSQFGRRSGQRCSLLSATHRMTVSHRSEKNLVNEARRSGNLLQATSRPTSLSWSRGVCALILASASAVVNAEQAAVGPAGTAGEVASAPSIAASEAVFTGYHPDRTRTYCFHPAYPTAAAGAGATGSTTLEITVDATSTVTRVVVVKSAGDTPAHKLLDQAAIDDIATCTINAARGRDGQPVSTTARMTFNWVLR